MKKSLFVLTVSALVATAANASFYVQGDLGYSKLSIANGPQAKKAGFSPSLSVGYQMNDWRFALDYTKQPKLNINYIDYIGDDTVDKGRLSVNLQSIGLSAAYDFDLGSQFKPYVSARISFNKAKVAQYIKEYNQNNELVAQESSQSSLTRVGYGVGAGVSYALNKNLALNVGVEYNYLGNFDNAKAKQFGAKLGLRYSF